MSTPEMTAVTRSITDRFVGKGAAQRAVGISIIAVLLVGAGCKPKSSMDDEGNPPVPFDNSYADEQERGGGGY